MPVLHLLSLSMHRDSVSREPAQYEQGTALQHRPVSGRLDVLGLTPTNQISRALQHHLTQPLRACWLLFHNFYYAEFIRSPWSDQHPYTNNCPQGTMIQACGAIALRSYQVACCRRRSHCCVKPQQAQSSLAACYSFWTVLQALRSSKLPGLMRHQLARLT